MKKTIKNSQGFTLIEIMVALAISGFIIAAIYITFSSQEKSQINQQEITDVQQNIRASMHIITTEIRQAGYQKDTSRSNDFCTGDDIGILEAGQGRVHFTMDITGGCNDGKDNDGDEVMDCDDIDDEAQFGDGRINDPNESIVYAFKPEDDADGDGIVDDGGMAVFCRETRSTEDNTDEDGIDSGPCGEPTSSGLQPMADGINAVRFTYFDEDGNNADTDGDGVVDIDLNDIRSVRIAILGRSKTSLEEFNDTNIYDLSGGSDLNGNPITGGTLPAFNDKYRRRLLVTTVKLRNMGM